MNCPTCSTPMVCYITTPTCCQSEICYCSGSEISVMFTCPASLGHNEWVSKYNYKWVKGTCSQKPVEVFTDTWALSKWLEKYYDPPLDKS